jgi:hypothetical protein
MSLLARLRGPSPDSAFSGGSWSSNQGNPESHGHRANRAKASGRLRTVRWRDLRLWLGLGLMIVAMIVGARLMTGSDEMVSVWRATRDLGVGAVPEAERVSVSLGTIDESYLTAASPLAGRMLLPVPVGALIPAAAVGTGTPSNTRMVTVAVDPLHAPTELAPGDRVDVWATQSDGAQTVSAPPLLALASVLVVAAGGEDVGLGGEIAVVLEVPADQVHIVVAAVRTGSIDLAAVPMSAEPVAAGSLTAEPVAASPVTAARS